MCQATYRGQQSGTALFTFIRVYKNQESTFNRNNVFTNFPLSFAGADLTLNAAVIKHRVQTTHTRRLSI